MITTEVSLEMVAAGEEEFRHRFAEKSRGFAPNKAACEEAAIAIYSAMHAALRTRSTQEGDKG